MEMKNFSLVQAFTAGSGALLVLKNEQVKTRQHNLELVEKGPDDLSLYRVINPVTFKTGETIGCDAAGLSRRDQIALGLEEAPEVKRSAARSGARARG